MLRIVNFTFILSFAILTICTTFEAKSIKCYTCLGQLFEDCTSAEVTCDHFCYKMIDRKHGVILKGCRTYKDVEEREEEIQNNDSLYEVTDKVVWTISDEPLEGYTRYCNTDFCNSSSKLTSSLLLFALSVSISLFNY